MPLASLASICLLRQYASCLCAFGIDMPLASLASICLMSCYISCASLLHLLRFSITSRASPLHLALFHSTSRALSKSFFCIGASFTSHVFCVHSFVNLPHLMHQVLRKCLKTILTIAAVQWLTICFTHARAPFAPSARTSWLRSLFEAA